MKTQRVKDWQGFVDAVRDLRRQYGRHSRPLGDGYALERPIELLFRGQPKASDDLKTTLERNSNELWHVSGYLTAVDHYRYEIESFTGFRWEVPALPERNEILRREQDFMRVSLPTSCYEFLVFLRHHGFPSPLLDWTASPYIALYFAYINASLSEDAAVYCYIPVPTGVKSGQGGKPGIHVLGPYVRTHRRHFIQKCRYSISTLWNEAAKRHDFCPHEKVIADSHANQDYLFKMVVPVAERGNMLSALDEVNINHYTLFQTTDALVRAMASREFDIGENSTQLRTMRITPPQSEPDRTRVRKRVGRPALE